MKFQDSHAPALLSGRTPLVLLATLLFTPLVAGSALANTGAAGTSDAGTSDASPRALGHQGELYGLQIGAFGELFPEAGADTPNVPNPNVPNPNVQVMALDITTPGATPQETTHQRLLVPGTETWRPEKAPRLQIDPTTGAALLVWQAGTNDGSSTLHFTSWRDGEWGPADQIRTAGEPYFFEPSPRLLVSNDRLDLELDGTTTVTVGRTLFHVLWIEAESQSVRYSPIPFVEGRYAGWNEVLTLSNTLTKSHEDEVPSDGSLPLLLDAAVIDAGHALSITLSEPTYGRLGTLRLAIRPPQLDLLGDEIIQEILEANPQLEPQHIQALLEKLAGRMIIIGSKMRLNPAITEYVTHHLGEWLMEHGPGFQGDLAALGEAARAEALDMGNLVFGRMIVDPSNPDAEIPELDLGDFLDSNGHRSQLAALVQLEVTADFEAPALGQDAVVYTSSDGSDMLVAWSDEAAVHYTENRGDGWSVVRHLPLSESLDLAAAHALLKAEIR